MNSPHGRRPGIDGLSRKPSPVTLHHHQHKSNHKSAPARPTRHEEHRLETTSPTPLAEQKGDFYVATSVSHPSLPVPHAAISFRHTSLLKKIVIYPFTQPIDKRTKHLAAAKQALDVRFWLLVSLPFVGLVVRRVFGSSSLGLTKNMKDLISGQNYALIFAVTAVLFLVVVISQLVASLSAQAMLGVKLRSIDHRPSDVNLFLRRGMSSVFKGLANAVLNLVLLSLVTILAAVVIYGLSLASTSWLVASRSLTISCAVILYLLFVILYCLRRPLQRAIAISTTQPVRFIQFKSWRLVVSSPLLSLGVALFWGMVAVLILGILITLSWAEFVYLGAHLSIPSRFAIWILGLSLTSLVWWAASIWNSMYWASSYHALVLKQDKSELSEYLVVQESSRLKRWPILVIAFATVIILVAFGLTAYFGREAIIRFAQESLSASHPLLSRISSVLR